MTLQSCQTSTVVFKYSLLSLKIRALHFLPLSSLDLIYLHCSHHAKQAEDGWVGVKSLHVNKPHMQHVQKATTTLSVLLLCETKEITNELCFTNSACCVVLVCGAGIVRCTHREWEDFQSSAVM